ncbi:MAG: alpha/beta fold hydrolase, partial [Pricia sp.]
ALTPEDLTSRSKADDALKKHITTLGIRQFLLKNLYWIEKGKLAFRFNLEILRDKMEEVGENIGSLDTYDGPTLFLRGDRSEYISESDLPEFQKHFPQARMETVTNAGHWLHAENPEQFFEKSISFLKA